MKEYLRLFSAIAFLSMSAVSHAFVIHDDQYGFYCDFSINESGYATSEELGPKGPGVCWRKEIMDKADAYIKDNGLKYKKPFSNYDVGVDVFKVCVAGAENKATHYINILDKYTGEAVVIKKLQKAYEYGKRSARTYDDCTSYVTGR
ncbi:hypothetical protein CBW54_15810 [Yersinia kristensenii]|nr:hypothetical protein CBW54_15810 [Yersinia kristensenii]